MWVFLLLFEFLALTLIVHVKIMITSCVVNKIKNKNVCVPKYSKYREQGWRSGRALAFHQCGPGSIPGLGVISGLSLLVLYSAPRGFSPGTPVFPSPQN